ncbi:MAG TPA: nucleotidyl transferase AbiEii/AbiGii toxin family protein [Woeseiaceae bacterium]|nr:nucleotidyl transferase AbiEii/AbiGii toxin family protein [Woeseiaceae bacterium]
MKKQANKNIAASVQQRLLNVSRETGRPFNETLQYFAMERLLYRLSCSAYNDSLVLKGALLFRVWDVPDSRATRDIDFLAFLDNSPANLAAVFREVCAIEGDDGLVFDPDSIDAKTIKEDADYEGVRVRFRGLLGKTRITMQIDIGFGDKVHPGVVRAVYPVILDLPAPALRMYPPETVIAEKVEAMVHLGSLNSRMKDFYDVWRLSRQFEFEDSVLVEAIRQTFDNRGTELVPFSELKTELLENETLEKLWSAFRAKTGVTAPLSFHEVLDEIALFLKPLLERIYHRQ